MSVISRTTADQDRRSHDGSESHSSPLRYSGSYISSPLKKHQIRRVSGGSNPRGNRGSSTTATQLELMAELRNKEVHINDNRTEFGSFKSRASLNHNRSMRVDSDGYSRLSSQIRKIPQKRNGAKLADFMIGDKIGEGSYARVHVARGKSSGELYALKVMDVAHIKKHGKVSACKLEMATLAKVNCAHIIRLTYAFKEGSALYLVLELCQGGDLSQLIQHRKAEEGAWRCLSMPDLVFYIAETIAGLQYLHHNGYVHRDIKPGNLLLSNRGHIKIADFGTVKNERNKEPEEPEFVGSPNYVSPEILNGAPFHSVGVDLWAVGVLAYHLWIGSPPFQDEAEYLIIDSITKHTAESFIHLPIEEGKTLSPEELMVEDLVNKLIRVDPASRLGAANNRTPVKSDYDRNSNQPSELRDHGLFADVDWSTLAMQEAPKNPVRIEFEEPQNDGADKNWLMLGDATDLDIIRTFSKQVRKVKGRPGRSNYNQRAGTLKTMDIQRDSKLSMNSSNELRTIKLAKPKVHKTKSNRAKKLSSFLNSRPSLTQITGRIQQGVKKRIQLKRVRRGSKDSTLYASLGESHFHNFLEEAEEITLCRKLKKRNGLFLKARYLVLTNKPRFLWFDPARPDTPQGEMIVNHDTELFIGENEVDFKIISGNHYVTFVETDSALQWKAAFMLEQNKMV